MYALLEYAKFNYFVEWIVLLCVGMSIVLCNRLFGLKYVNALFPAQVIAAINSVPIIAGFVDGYLGYEKVIHFFVTEAVLMVAICTAYSKILHWGSGNVEGIARFFRGYVPIILIAVSAVLAIFTYIVTPQDGTSRILYQTNYWYSLVKPIAAIVTPVSFFGVFVILTVNNQRFVAYTLLIVSVLGNMASGSKGAFVIQAITALLMARDLGLMSQFRLRRTDLVLATSALVSGAVLSLQRLELEAGDVWNRIMLFGESTLLTYFAPDSTAACRSLSLLAKMHRGWARALGDPGALDIDTLFGYAWTIQYLGVNTFTGPNARFSSYLICNFPGVEVVLGLVMTLIYLVLSVWVVRTSTKKAFMVPVIYAFVMFSFSWVGQDFNLLMQDINYMIGMIFVMIILPGFSFRKPLPSQTREAIP